MLNYASSLGGGENAFTLIPSERDEEHQFGLQIPYKGWLLDVDTFKNRVNNFLDHSNLGESNMYFPIAVDGALVRAWEMTLRSPRLARLGQFHLTYSNQIAEQRGTLSAALPARIHGRSGLLSAGFQLHSRRSRPARHAEHRLHDRPSTAHVVLHQCLLRVGVLEWPGMLRPVRVPQ